MTLIDCLLKKQGQMMFSIRYDERLVSNDRYMIGKNELNIQRLISRKLMKNILLNKNLNCFESCIL